MLKASLGIVVLAVASLFVGLFVATDTLAFIVAAVALAALAIVTLVVGVVVQPGQGRAGGPGSLTVGQEWPVVQPTMGCPDCGSPMQRGSVVGQYLYLNWIPEGQSPGVVTVLGKEHLAVGSLFRPPMLDAAICRACRAGTFRLDRA